MINFIGKARFCMQSLSLVLCIFTCLLSTTVMASNQPDSQSNISPNDSFSADKITLTVSIEAIGYPPYQFVEDDINKGFTIDVLDYFEEHSNYHFEYIVLPWPRALHLVEKGEVDMILTLFRNKKREAIYHYIEPSYGYEVNQLFALVGHDIIFTGRLPELVPYSIGTRRAFSYGKAFDNASYLTKVPALTEEVVLNLLLANRVDIAIANPFIFNNLIQKKEAQSKVIAIDPYVELTPVYLALTKQRSDSLTIKSTLDKLSTQLKSSAYYGELLDKYQLNFTQ